MKLIFFTNGKLVFFINPTFFVANNKYSSNIYKRNRNLDKNHKQLDNEV